jgi:hypothetical protein
MRNILRDEANFDILSGFLSELLRRQVHVRETFESANKDFWLGKMNRIDLKGTIGDGESAVFEIQFADQIDFWGKVWFKGSKAALEQMSRGEFRDIKKFYSVSIA